MIDVSRIPTAEETPRLQAPLGVPANQMTTAQQQVVQAVWDSIQLARKSSKINSEDLAQLEQWFDSLTSELNRAYREITMDRKSEMQYLQQHLHGLATQASQFSSMVHQHIHRTAEGEEKIVALQVANKSNNDNLKILAQIVQGEAALQNNKDSKIEHWAKQKNKEVSELLGDTTLTKKQVSQLRNELQWERA